MRYRIVTSLFLFALVTGCGSEPVDPWELEESNEFEATPMTPDDEELPFPTDEFDLPPGPIRPTTAPITLRFNNFAGSYGDFYLKARSANHCFHFRFILERNAPLGSPFPNIAVDGDHVLAELRRTPQCGINEFSPGSPRPSFVRGTFITVDTLRIDGELEMAFDDEPARRYLFEHEFDLPD